MDVEVVCRSARAGLRVMTLRGGQLPFRFYRSHPPQRGEHLLGASERVVSKHQIGIDARTQVRRGVHRVSEARSLEQQDVDAIRRQRVKDSHKFLLARRVEDGRELQVARQIRVLSLAAPIDAASSKCTR